MRPFRPIPTATSGSSRTSAAQRWPARDCRTASFIGSRRRIGMMQALQVMSKANPGQPVAFQTASALTQDIKDMHTYGVVFDTKWVTIHDTDTDGFAAFNANALAKARSA